MSKNRRHRITSHGDFQVWKGSRWTKDSVSASNPAKNKRWQEQASKREERREGLGGVDEQTEKRKAGAPHAKTAKKAVAIQPTVVIIVLWKDHFITNIKRKDCESLRGGK